MNVWQKDEAERKEARDQKVFGLAGCKTLAFSENEE